MILSLRQKTFVFQSIVCTGEITQNGRLVSSFDHERISLASSQTGSVVVATQDAALC